MRTPIEILEKFEKAALGLEYGTVTLILHIKQGKTRYVVTREESYIHKDDLNASNGFFSKEETDLGS